MARAEALQSFGDVRKVSSQEKLHNGDLFAKYPIVHSNGGMRRRNNGYIDCESRQQVEIVKLECQALQSGRYC
eukprot:2008567-Pleurochrysis_carterae.AAC.2